MNIKINWPLIGITCASAVVISVIIGSLSVDALRTRSLPTGTSRIRPSITTSPSDTLMPTSTAPVSPNFTPTDPKIVGPTDEQNSTPRDMLVLDLRYIPVRNGKLDPKYMEDGGLHGKTLADMQARINGYSQQVIDILTQGSVYRRDPEGKPFLHYRVVASHTYTETIPPGKEAGELDGTKIYFPDFNKILERENICDWVDNKGIREVWLWGYHFADIVVVESNMAGPFGDYSNSSCYRDDMPTCQNTYTLYNYNYSRGVGEAVENHTHQIEVVLNIIGKRTNLKLFEKNFIGYYPWFVCFLGKGDESCTSNRGVRAPATPYNNEHNDLGIPLYKNESRIYDLTTPRACGWTHYPPNARWDYDWENPEEIESNCYDWHPDGSGETTKISCADWGCKNDPGTAFKRWWMQSIPGRHNELEYEGQPLNNWWIFIADFDIAMKEQWSLARRQLPVRQ